VDLYMILYDAILKNSEGVAHGREGFYFGENGDYTFLQANTTIGEALFALGKSKVAEPSQYTETEFDTLFAVSFD
jgi:hypothetical protein